MEGMKLDLQRFAHMLGAQKSAANFDVGAGELECQGNADKMKLPRFAQMRCAYRGDKPQA